MRNYTAIMLNDGVGPMRQTCAHAGDYQIEECRRLKALPGGADTPCIVYWNGQNALGWYLPPPPPPPPQKNRPPPLNWGRSARRQR
eukprot:SAG11_NODE_189_length_13028_cov_14.222446_14_plen_86_part_00